MVELSQRFLLPRYLQFESNFDNNYETVSDSTGNHEENPQIFMDCNPCSNVCCD